MWKGSDFMYAIVKTGGKQVRLSPGETVKVEKVEGNVGEEVVLSHVLFVKGDESVLVGQPIVNGASVTCDIVEQGRGKKLLVYKYKKRKGYKKMIGHRQGFTGLLVKEINVPS